jgi:alkylmercury lyase-like protein
MLVEMLRHIFREFADTGLPPELTKAELAELAAAHAVVLDGAGRIAFANPFAARPSNSRVQTPSGSYDAVCVWDALGIAALLGPTARIETRCPDCSAPLSLEVRDGDLVPTGYAVHFLVPAARWYDDIAFT